MGLTKADIYKTLFLSTVISAAPVVAIFSQDKSDKKDCVPGEDLKTPNKLTAWDKTTVRDFNINQYDKDNTLITSEHFKEYPNWGVDIIKPDATKVEIDGYERSFGDDPGNAHFAYRPLDDKGKPISDSYFIINDWKNIDANIFKENTLYELVEFSTKGFKDFSQYLKVIFEFDVKKDCYSAKLIGDETATIEGLTASTVGRIFRQGKDKEVVLPSPPYEEPSSAEWGIPDDAPEIEVPETEVVKPYTGPPKVSVDRLGDKIPGVDIGVWYLNEILNNAPLVDKSGAGGYISTNLGLRFGSTDNIVRFLLNGGLEGKFGNGWYNPSGESTGFGFNAQFGIGLEVDDFRLDGAGKYSRSKESIKDQNGTDDEVKVEGLGGRVSFKYLYHDKHSVGIFMELSDETTETDAFELDGKTERFGGQLRGSFANGNVEYLIEGSRNRSTYKDFPNIQDNRTQLTGQLKFPLSISQKVAAYLGVDWYWIDPVTDGKGKLQGYEIRLGIGKAF